MTCVAWIWVCVAFVTALGCSRSDAKSELPPATGSGVAPPQIPKVSALMMDNSGGASNAEPRGLTGTGTLYPRESAELGPKASGTLSAVLVDEGDHVKKGQVLFRLEAAQAGLGVQQARSQLESARVALRAAELDYQRTKELYERGSVAVAVYDQLQARYDTAKNAVSQAEVALSMAQKTSADTVVRSPIDGVVTKKAKNVGETVTMTPPTVVLVIQDLSVLELRVRLPDRALAKLTPGSELDMKVPALGITEKVKVKRINPAVDIATRTVEVIADVDNANGRLRSGLLAEVSFDAEPDAEKVASAGGAAGAGAPNGSAQPRARQTP